MTADMVDGMGTSGTQGVFQRCAEETLRVLREGSEVIMTVLEVFKHDPLHSWLAFIAFSTYKLFMGLYLIGQRVKLRSNGCKELLQRRP
jgi:Phosphatidylinositol kinase and protein kinases of the PI-3 kinase family